MYGKVLRDAAYKTKLLEFICREYALNGLSLTEAKRGFYGETWQIETPDRRYFVKLDYSSLHQSAFRDSIAIVEYLCRNGIDFISQVIPTNSGSLFSYFDTAILGLFEWIDGDNVQNEKTKIHEYQMLAKIYTVSVVGVPINTETFDTAYIETLNAQCSRLNNIADDASARRLMEIFRGKSALIQYYAKRYAMFAERCKEDHSDFFITHGDAGGNIIVNDDTYFIIDWDEPRLAPPERDAWFCMHWGWAMDAFHDSLRQCGVEYTLKPERLAFYCYQNFFQYLTEYLTAFFDLPEMRSAILESISGYFDGWIKDNLQYADTIQRPAANVEI